MPSFAMEGPRCDRCGGPSGRAVRTRELATQPEKVYYLAYSWACDVCGHSWVDDGLERLNARAAEGARVMRHRDGYAGRRAS